ncbi:hypothetical protein SEUCBS139899_002003 [Sporothrix eucalyptigena]|uniref:Uncharacterized protein n=1 Tax=Sporothrix eucalyptigena TaxID=1812306 RepID=A0ABP0CBX5_9PEZI
MKFLLFFIDPLVFSRFQSIGVDASIQDVIFHAMHTWKGYFFWFRVFLLVLSIFVMCGAQRWHQEQTIRGDLEKLHKRLEQLLEDVQEWRAAGHGEIEETHMALLRASIVHVAAEREGYNVGDLTRDLALDKMMKEVNRHIRKVRVILDATWKEEEARETDDDGEHDDTCLVRVPKPDTTAATMPDRSDHMRLKKPKDSKSPKNSKNTKYPGNTKESIKSKI